MSYMKTTIHVMGLRNKKKTAFIIGQKGRARQLSQPS